MTKMKILFAAIFAISFFSCRQDTQAGKMLYTDVSDFEKSGMHYVIYNNEIKGGIFIVNVTKDSLEVEYYKTQLNKK